jgi:hypothetical protein
VYVWAPPGKSISVRLSLDVVDRMLQDVMRGFGAVPKRGAEVGGVLLGRAAPGETRIVTIDDYELVPIEYKRSPSYLLSEEDTRTFEAVVERVRNNPDPLLRPVGCFRSHTRDSVGLGPEDLAILNLHFPEPDAVALIVKPFGTRVSQAGFYFKEDGEFQSGLPLLEFPFRRRELDPGGGAGHRARPAGGSPIQAMPSARRERAGYPTDLARTMSSAAQRASEPPAAFADEPLEEPGLQPELPSVEFPLEPKPKRRGEVWLPVSFILFSIGVLLGFLAANLSLRPQLPAGSNDPYNLNLTVTKQGDDLLVKWDRTALATRTASKGSLTIEDGGYSKVVQWNAQDLQSGSVVYPPGSNNVKFRLEVVLSERDSLVETVEWQWQR